MRFFISINGKVYADNCKNRDIPRLDTSELGVENDFEDRERAHAISFELEERHPIIYYGKCSTKAGLRADARGDSTAAYQKQR